MSEEPPKKRARTSAGFASASIASYFSSPTSSSMPSSSSSSTGLTVGTTELTVFGGQQHISGQVEFASPPTTPNTKTSVVEKLKSGAQQMDLLLKAIQASRLSKTQGKDWQMKLVKKGQVTDFLRERLNEQIAQCKRRSAFDYLRDQSISSNPEKVKEYIDALDDKHGLCILAGGSGYPQIKIPSASQTVSQSDQKAGKAIGLIQVQSYNLAAILDEVKTDDELVVSIQATLAEVQAAHRVSAHLCKKVCLNAHHTARVSANVNVKFHESCAAMWVINDQLFSFCHCPSGKGTCFAPGTLFAADPAIALAFAANVQSLLANTSNVTV